MAGTVGWRLFVAAKPEGGEPVRAKTGPPIPLHLVSGFQQHGESSLLEMMILRQCLD
jgi:hypothetical protein